jgi:MFS family permease
MQAAFFPVLTTIPLHIVAHATDLGMGATQAATVLSVIGGASIAGRLLVGPAADRIGGRNAYLLCFSILLVSLLVIRQSESHQWLYLFALVYGFAHGGFFTVVSPTIAEYFDMKVHSSVFGAIVFFGTIGGALGPLLAGYSFDGTGSYNTAFTALIILAVIGIALSASLNRPASRVQQAKPATS